MKTFVVAAAERTSGGGVLCSLHYVCVARSSSKRLLGLSWALRKSACPGFQPI